jgi:hypothetical protein
MKAQTFLALLMNAKSHSKIFHLSFKWKKTLFSIFRIYDNHYYQIIVPKGY